MEPVLGECDGGDDSDVEMTSMRKELVDFGLTEDDLSKEEMSNLLKALRCSRSSATEEELQRSKANRSSSGSAEVDMADAYTGDSVSPKVLRRRYRAAVDRRLPWCLLPPDLTPGQRVQCLAAYIKLLTINQYRRARNLANFEPWAPGVSVSTGVPAGPARATRSGRCMPSYTHLDDDDDMDIFVPKRSRKRRVSSSETTACNDVGIYTNRTFSLKRKPQKTDCDKPEKESKIDDIAEVSIWSVEPVNNLNNEKVDVEKTSESFCTLIDSICNSSNGEKSNIAKDHTRITKTRQRKT